MKNILFGLLLVLFSFMPTTECKAQVDYAVTPYIGWQLVGTPSWTTPSWFYCVTRSTYKDANGYYWFDVWFASNSYIWDRYNGVREWRFVQIYKCTVYFDNNRHYGGDFSFRDNYSPSSLRYKSKNPLPYMQGGPSFRIYWGGFKRL